MAVLTPSAKLQFININGQPLIGGRLYTYAAGTTTPLATYADAAATTTNPNPIILDARGEASVWLGASTYKFRLTDSSGNEIWTVDYISSPISSISPALSGNVTIDTDSSSPAIKITQLGTGAILRAQDSTDPDVTPFIIDSDGRVGIGTASPQAGIDVANNNAIVLTNNGITRSVMSASIAESYFAALGAGRNLVLQSNGISRVTVSEILITSTLPIQLPGLPTTALQAATKSYVDQVMPPGMIMSYGGSAAPTGWLACQGQVVSQTTYANLYAAIGAAWDIGGEGAGNFRLPDLRGVFLRGTGVNATGSSTGATGQAVGTYVADTYLNHSHTATSTDAGHTHIYASPGAGTGFAGGVNLQNVNYTTTPGFADITTTVATSTTGGTETKPKNYGVLYIIKT
jgi:microcystin-dependent protein